MFRKLIPLAVLVVLILGCKKETADTEGGAGDGSTDSDPSATFTLKFRDEQAGDKTEHTTTETSTTEIGTDGKSEKQKQDKKLEYTEHIIDMPAGAAKPTKLTRAYKVAQGFDKKAGAMKTFPYEGKAVSIEKKGAFYEFTADGKRMDSKDATDLSREFSSQSKSSDDELLPKKPVKVGESWTVDLVALKRLSGNTSLPIDMPKSKLTAKLTRAYTRDGKQWGVIAIDFDLVIDSSVVGMGKGGRTAAGTMKATITLDRVIDGSARDGTTTMNMKMDMTGKEGGPEVRVVADMVSTKTIRTLK